jgi:hypothetical protein
VPILHSHLSRVLGTDIRAGEGEHQVALALLDIYSHALVSPELAVTARAGLDAPYRHPTPHRPRSTGGGATRHHPQPSRSSS